MTPQQNQLISNQKILISAVFISGNPHKVFFNSMCYMQMKKETTKINILSLLRTLLWFSTLPVYLVSFLHLPNIFLFSANVTFISTSYISQFYGESFLECSAVRLLKEPYKNLYIFLFIYHLNLLSLSIYLAYLFVSSLYLHVIQFDLVIRTIFQKQWKKRCIFSVRLTMEETVMAGVSQQYG